MQHFSKAYSFHSIESILPSTINPGIYPTRMTQNFIQNVMTLSQLQTKLIDEVLRSKFVSVCFTQRNHKMVHNCNHGNNNTNNKGKKQQKNQLDMAPQPTYRTNNPI